ncbi:Shikimate O-hydroxycinnamoyltransferase [Phytophthora cinnamomi]|uniref:Shikimate O-hydroxycinnamoyltransferase n=1 Tax=Phytophthora cinnamomi TaxID=4785 RepID=UPI00355AC11E|nr:Shikimate O-hydroxycinnamoyltransferase [Phytophthora cinnamomi]
MPPTQTEDLTLPLTTGSSAALIDDADDDCSKERLLPLSPLDAMMHKLGVMLLYIFPCPASSSAAYDLTKLKSSFVTLVDEDYPILIGELHMDPETGAVSVKQTAEARQVGAAGIRFETNQESSMATEEAMATLSWQLMPTPRGSTELFGVKATLLWDGGLVIGVDGSHTMLDGEGMFTFVTLWGQHYRGVNKEERLVINHDRHLLGGSGSPAEQTHPEFQVIETKPATNASEPPSAPVPPPTSQHRFHFTPALMKKIKDVASQEAEVGPSDPSYVSTIDAITALFTALISQARGHGLDVKVTTAVNARCRLNPPLPPNYAGNVIFSALSSYNAAELRREDNEGDIVSPSTLARLAQRVRGSIRGSDDHYLRDAINFMTSQSNLLAVQPATNFVFGPDIMYTSWVRTGMYDAEFEGTHPWFVSVPPLPFDGFVIITEAPKGSPGVDVLVFLESTAMEKLKDFFAQVTYLRDEQT